MTDSQKERTTDDVLQDLHEFLQGDPLDVDSLTDEEVNAELAKRGIDSDKGFSVISDMIDDAVAASELAAARQQRETKLAAQKQPPKSNSSLRDKLRQFLTFQDSGFASAFASKLETCEDEDLDSLIADLQELGIDDFLKNNDAKTDH